MKQIRKGVFETNSSSTHSICIAVETELNYPKSLHFRTGEFGWEQGSLRSVYAKASYLYTGLLDNGRIDDFKAIVDTLKSKGIEVTYEDPESDGFRSGYIDHACELHEFLDAICSDETTLLNYLFSDLSFILTSNDNGGGGKSSVEINVPYVNEVFYKGN